MSQYKYLDNNGLLYLWNKAKGTFVLQVTGKGLSTNDLTDALKAAYDAAVARINSLTVPTAVSELTNDAGYQTGTQVTAAINSAIADISGVEFVVAQTLPVTGDAGTIYLVPHGGTGTDIYDEYIYYNNAWEKIGSTDVDLSGYVQASEMSAITNTEIDTICT